MDHLVTVKELNESIESWMENRYELDIKFDGKEALQQLEKLNLLKSQKLGNIFSFFFLFMFSYSYFTEIIVLIIVSISSVLYYNLI